MPFLLAKRSSSGHKIARIVKMLLFSCLVRLSVASVLLSKAANGRLTTPRGSTGDSLYDVEPDDRVDWRGLMSPDIEARIDRVPCAFAAMSTSDQNGRIKGDKARKDQRNLNRRKKKTKKLKARKMMKKSRTKGDSSSSSKSSAKRSRDSSDSVRTLLLISLKH